MNSDHSLCRLMFQFPSTLLREVQRLIQAWWRVDRIRISPNEGALLRLTVGAMLHWEGQWWMVESRCVGDGVEGAFVRYECRCGDSTAGLEVSPSPPLGTGMIRWTIGDKSRILEAGALDVYESGR